MKKKFVGMDCQECKTHDYYFLCRTCVEDKERQAKKEVFDDLEQIKFQDNTINSIAFDLNKFDELKKKHLGK